MTAALMNDMPRGDFAQLPPWCQQAVRSLCWSDAAFQLAPREEAPLRPVRRRPAERGAAAVPGGLPDLGGLAGSLRAAARRGASGLGGAGEEKDREHVEAGNDQEERNRPVSVVARGRTPCDWTLQVEPDPYSFGRSGWWPAAAQYRLTVTLDVTQANQLLESDRGRGYLAWTFSMRAAQVAVEVSGIELSAEEAARVAQGDNVLDVLLGQAWPELGYTLRAVPDPLLG